MKKYKYIIVMLWLALLSTVLPLPASAEKVVKTSTLNVSLKFDDVNIKLPVGQHAFIYKDTTYVPVRYVSYALQKDVQWNGKTKEVTLSAPNSSQLTAIKQLITNTSNSSTNVFKPKTITLTPINVKFLYIAQTTVIKEKSSFMLNGTLYVPIRFLSELVGTEITWNPKELLITGKSQLYKEKEVTDLTDSKDTGAQSPSTEQENSGVGNPTVGTGAGGSSSANTYEKIIAKTEGQLNDLYARSKASLTGLALQYITANDADKVKIKSQGKQMLDEFSSAFESIVQNTENQLKASGYSTEVIKQYRDKFASEIKLGKELAGGLAE